MSSRRYAELNARERVFIKEHHISAIQEYARTQYGESIFTEHFMVRAYQRLNPQDRLRIFSELRELIKSGMAQYLFDSSADKINLLVAEKYEVVFAKHRNTFKVKTVFEPPETRRERLRNAQ